MSKLAVWNWMGISKEEFKKISGKTVV